MEKRGREQGWRLLISWERTDKARTQTSRGRTSLGAFLGVLSA